MQPEPDLHIVGVRMRRAGKISYFHSGGMRLEPGEYVVVESSRGPELARVVIAPGQVVVNELGEDDLPPILRLATEADIRRADALMSEAEETLPKVRALAAEIGFQGHVDNVEFALDRRRMSISFTSEERVEYRDLVRAASDRFGIKVDVRHIGARDRARLAGGYGVCGRELCCSSWLNTFPSISIRMAKEQDLPLNPQKISGLCGRLLCCLSYEEAGYKEMRKTLPRLGQRCSTPTGEGKVIAVNTLRRQVTLIVEGQRIEVTDRDLGTVVRWDPSSKAAEPPPSLTRQEAIEQGLIEDTGEPEPAASPWDETDFGPGRGRLPVKAPRRVVRQRPEPAAPDSSEPADAPARGARRPRGRRPVGPPPSPRGAGSTPPQGGRSRSFQRAPRDVGEGEQPPAETPRERGPATSGDEGQRRRGRRGGRGRGRGEQPGGSEN